MEYQPNDSYYAKATADPFVGDDYFADLEGCDLGTHLIDRNFTTNATGLVDLVDATYVDIIENRRDMRQRMPLTAYQYYVYCAFWGRALNLAKAGGEPLGEFSEDLDVLNSTEEWTLHPAIVAYLSGMGDYTSRKGIKFRYQLPVVARDFSNQEFNGFKGSVGMAVDNVTARKYLQCPIPCCYVQALHRTIRAGGGEILDRENWSMGIEPADWRNPAITPDRRVMTEDVIGWRKIPTMNASYAEAFAALGWRAGGPSDLTNKLLVSGTTLRHISAELREIGKRLKVVKAIDLRSPGGSVAQHISTSPTSTAEFCVRRGLTTCASYSSDSVEGKIWRAGAICGYHFVSQQGSKNAALVGGGWFVNNGGIIRMPIGLNGDLLTRNRFEYVDRQENFVATPYVPLPLAQCAIERASQRQIEGEVRSRKDRVSTLEKR